MKKSSKNLRKSLKGLTGLGAAIILISFIITAAAFAFTVLNMGFLTSQKAGETISTGLEQSSSSIQIVGAVFAFGNTTADKVRNITIYIGIGAGKIPVDLSSNKLVVTYQDPYIKVDDIYSTNSTSNGCQIEQITGDGDNMLEYGEEFKVTINLEGTAIYNGQASLTTNDKFHIDIKPPLGSVLTVERWIPPSIDTIMNLG